VVSKSYTKQKCQKPTVVRPGLSTSVLVSKFKTADADESYAGARLITLMDGAYKFVLGPVSHSFG